MLFYERIEAPSLPSELHCFSSDEPQMYSNIEVSEELAESIWRDNMQFLQVSARC